MQSGSAALLTRSLTRWVREHCVIAPNDVLVSEMCFYGRKNRADLVLANGTLTAFEIKSARDRMCRWAQQQKAYLSVFDKVWLCVHHRHLQKAHELISPNVGLMLSDDYGGIVVLREAKSNRAQKMEFYAELLWRSEIDDLLSSVGIKQNRSMRIAEARKEMIAKVPEIRIRKAVIEAIKKRYPEYQISPSSSSTEVA